MNYKNLFENFFSGLRENKNIILTEDFYLRDEFLPGFIEKSPFLNSIFDELFVMNDNYLCWEYKNTNRNFPMGEFHFISIAEIVDKESSVVITDKKNDSKVTPKIRRFDDHPKAGDGIAACINFDNNDLWLLNENGELFKIKLELKNYFIESVNFKAVYGWQYLFTDIKWDLPYYTVLKKDLKYRLEILKTLFKEHNYDEFIKILS